MRFGHQLHALALCRRAGSPRSISATTRIALGADDAVILAVPPYAAAALVPGLTDADRIPRHRQCAFPHRSARRTCRRSSACVNGTTEWLFAFPGRLSVTISAADRLHRHAARRRWRRRSGARSPASPACRPTLPPWQIVRERRATFAATPEQDARRPGAKTSWSNLFLAGDWTDTGLPATIEGAIRSGQRAADLVATDPRSTRSNDAR